VRRQEDGRSRNRCAPTWIQHEVPSLPPASPILHPSPRVPKKPVAFGRNVTPSQKHGVFRRRTCRLRKNTGFFDRNRRGRSSMAKCRNSIATKSHKKARSSRQGGNAWQRELFVPSCGHCLQLGALAWDLPPRWPLRRIL